MIAIAAAACAPRPHPTAPSAPSVGQRLAAIDDLLRAGCYDCLVEALEGAQQLAGTGTDPQMQPARDRVVESAGLLAIRERILGLIDHQYLERARAAASTEDQRFVLDVVATVPRRSAGQRAAGDAGLEATLTASRNRSVWKPRLLSIADADPLTAVAALAYDCGYAGRDDGGPSVADAIPTWRETPLVQFASASCAGIDIPRLSALLDADPRFREIEYYLGLSATLKGDLDEADRRFQLALEWRRDWPAVTIAIANTAMTAENFDRAASFYRSTLELNADDADAQLGLVRALSFGGQYAAASEVATHLLEGHWYTGEAYYWRAWNETALNQLAPAWDDVGAAAKLVINADVPKLTGILAIRRNDLVRARAEFAQAHERNGGDCETLALLGGTELELSSWSDATPVLVQAVSCLDDHDKALEAEIVRLRARGGRDRVIARREAELAADARLRAQSWFNLAVASFDLGDKPSARMYAERLVSDDHFGERARQLLDRLRQ